MLEVARTRWSEVVVSGRYGNDASPVPLQKHWPGGCTIDIPLSICHRLGAYRFAAHTLFLFLWYTLIGWF